MKNGQLTLASYVVLAVFLIFVIVCVTFFGPLVTSFINANPGSFGSEKYGLYIIPAVLVLGAIVAFFMPNTVVGSR